MSKFYTKPQKPLETLLKLNSYKKENNQGSYGVSQSPKLRKPYQNNQSTPEFQNLARPKTDLNSQNPHEISF